MSSGLPTLCEELTVDQAALIDAVCDRFEQAWKEAIAGGPAPHLESYMGGDELGSAGAILVRELAALDRACRERYGRSARFGEAADAGSVDADTSVEHPVRQSGNVRTDQPTIPGLELVKVVGSGGMGVVFKARQTTLGRDVAVKFLRDAHRADLAQRERFLREARAVAHLRHPNLVQLYEFGQATGADGMTPQPYLVLEYVPGGSLADFLHGSPQPPRDAARLVETLADAIHYAHQQGVIHRDLKPANVLLQNAEPGMRNAESKSDKSTVSDSAFRVSHSAIPKVTDFGLAKFLVGDDLTRSGFAVGTPGYMAPEQAEGKSTPLTAAVDVYGLGAILYEMLTGRPPFAAATVDATLGLVRDNEPVPPRRLQPTVPLDLETICLKCLRKDAGRRYASAQDLAEDLRRFQAGKPILARPVGSVERVVGWCRRNPVVATLLAALVLVFLCGTFGVFWQWQRATRNAAAFRRERDTARLEKERAERQLQIVRHRVDHLNRIGRSLLLRQGQFRTGQAVLEEALAFYQDLLPDEGNDPTVRREAAELYREVADIYFTLGQASKATEAYLRQASLLTTLLNDDPQNKELRYDLAHSHRRRGNLMRHLNRGREAREAYGQAIDLQEELLRESPTEARYQAALANTLRNTATLLSPHDQTDELEQLYCRIVDLDRAAVCAAPEGRHFAEELALALGEQSLFFLALGREAEAEAPARESLEIYQKLIDGGQRKGESERHAARGYVNLGRVLAASGRTAEAEQSHQKAVTLLERLVKEMPESAIRETDLAQALAVQADLLVDLDRRGEAEAIRRRVIRLYEKLKADFPQDPRHRRHLVHNYLELVTLLWQLGRESEATELYRKALDVDVDDPVVNNTLAWFLATCQEPCLRDAPLAVRLAQRAATAAPESGEYHTTLGVAHYRNGDHQAAVAELETARRLRGGGDSFDWFFLAMAYGRLGNPEKAEKWFHRAVQWMGSHTPHNGELIRFRAEAGEVLAQTHKN
jgi:tetratricopeptide (TPR) repeat protein